MDCSAQRNPPHSRAWVAQKRTSACRQNPSVKLHLGTGEPTRSTATNFYLDFGISLPLWMTMVSPVGQSDHPTQTGITKAQTFVCLMCKEDVDMSLAKAQVLP